MDTRLTVAVSALDEKLAKLAPAQLITEDLPIFIDSMKRGGCGSH